MTTDRLKETLNKNFGKKLGFTETDELLYCVIQELVDISDSLVKVTTTNIDMRMYIANQNNKLDKIIGMLKWTKT